MLVRIVTDSSAVLPPTQITEHGIEVVPLTLSWDGEDFRNGDISYEAFARRAGSGSVPTTSAPSPGHYEEAYRSVLADADELVCVTPAAEVSATHQNATLAARIADADRVHVVDSRSAVAGQGLVALEAARAAAEGSASDAVARAKTVAAGVRLWATLERLDYLRRSGRVPGVAAFATDALALHPVFKFVDGSPSPVTAPRGGKRAISRVVRAWTESVPEAPARCHAFVFHADRASGADTIRERIHDRSPEAEVSVVQVSAAVAAHIGPGTLGVAWWWETDDARID